MDKHLLKIRDLVMELKDLDERWREATLTDYRFTVGKIVACCECELVELGVLTAEYMQARRGILGDD